MNLLAGLLACPLPTSRNVNEAVNPKIGRNCRMAAA
jgi:hypothetical protein